jgi:ribosomal protein S18 acetylase RimI-like enzyme
LSETLWQVGDYTIILTDVPDVEGKSFLSEKIRSFNNVVSPQHLAIRTAGVQTLNVLIRDAQGAIAGGLAGTTYWGWLEVDKLWVGEPLRGQGHGRRLLLAAETEAQQRGCTRVFLTTFSFQARGFYEKQGYRVVGQLDDYPPGATFYWLRKDFAPVPLEESR